MAHVDRDDDEASWEFDTVRAPSIVESHMSGSNQNADDNASTNPTIRPPPSKVPSTLRMLFEDGESTPEPFRIPGFESPLPPTALNPSLLPPVAPPRGRGRSRSAISNNDEPEDVLTAKQPTFEFPPRTSTPRSTPSAKSSTSHLDVDETPQKEKPPPLGPGIPRGIHVGGATANGSDSAAPRYREIRSERGVPDIAIPILRLGEASQDSDPTLSIPLSTSSPDESSTRERINAHVSRQRSKSNAVDSISKPRREWTFPSPSDFHFPPVSDRTQKSSPPPAVPPLPPHTNGTHSRGAASHASVASLANTSRSSHQFTQSLDVSLVPRRTPSPGDSLSTPPPLTRSQSALPLSEKRMTPATNGGTATQKVVARKPSMTRQASVAVMETVASPLQPPSRPFARSREERRGSLPDVTPVPGLKDALKVSFSMSYGPGESLIYRVDTFLNRRTSSWHDRPAASFPVCCGALTTFTIP